MSYRIALIGSPGSGKTAIAHTLGHTISFAGTLRYEVAETLADATGEPVMTWVDRMLDPATKDEYRDLLQAWGSFRRQRDPDYWVRQVERRIRILSNADVLCVDDARMPNEYTMLKRMGFYFIRLLDGPYVRNLTGEQLQHESERYWREWDVDGVLVYNEGLQRQAQTIMQHIQELEEAQK